MSYEERQAHELLDRFEIPRNLGDGTLTLAFRIDLALHKATIEKHLPLLRAITHNTIILARGGEPQ